MNCSQPFILFYFFYTVACANIGLQLKKELSNFGPEFFEEIEDLKFRCHDAITKNKQYEEQLAKLSKQFGISVNIPGRWT